MIHVNGAPTPGGTGGARRDVPRALDRARAALAGALLGYGAAAPGASTPPGPPTIPNGGNAVELMTVIGSGAGSATGDFVSSAGGGASPTSPRPPSRAGRCRS